MAYKALYRKYRPRNFDEVVGQDPIIKTLKNAINQNKIAHAYLFCGPRGTGKTSVAKIFSMAVNCTGEDKPCMQCDSCKSFLEGDSPDVIEIDAASNNGVEEVRDLIDKVKYAPQVSKYKVYIIDEVHMMSVSAFNALLKTIEEPPKHVIFILATTDPHKVIPTIISRCQRYDFSSVSLDTMIFRLNEVMNSEEILYEDGVSERIAVLSDGGMRDALSILDQCVAYAGDSLKLSDIDNVYGSLNNGDLCNYLNYIIDSDTVGLFQLLQDIKNKGVDVKRVTQDLITLIKNILFYSYTKDTSNIVFMDQNTIDSILSKTTESNLIYYSECLIEANDKMKQSSDIQTYFELTSLKLIGIANNVSRETVPTYKSNNVSRETSREDSTMNQRQPTNETKEVVNEIIEDREQVDIIHKEDEYVNIDMELNNYVIEDSYDSKSNEAINKEKSQSESLDLKSTNSVDEESNIIQRETLEHDENLLLRLLLSANKEYKSEASSKYDKNIEYSNEFQWAKQSNVIRNIEIVAAGKNYMIVKASNRIHAELIEDKKNDTSFQKYVKELFGDYKHIYALASKEVDHLINEYVKRRAEGTLPDALVLDDLIIDDTEIEIDETTKRVMDLFGEDNINMEE